MDESLRTVLFVCAGVLVKSSVDFVRTWLASRSKKISADTDLSIRQTEIAIKAQELVQGDFRYLRDWIDKLNTQVGILELQLAEKDKAIASKELTIAELREKLDECDKHLTALTQK